MEGRSSSTRRLAHLSRLLAATPGPTATTTAAAPALSDADLETFNSEGVLVLRDFFSAEELAAISTPIAELQSAPGSPLLDESSKKFNFPDFQGLCQRPALATASFDHPRVVGAVQRALGEDAAELSQFGALTWAPDAAGVGLHYDYKPFRVVGSFLDWLFCIIPLTDYNEHDGPLLVRPRSHSFTTVLPHDDGNDPGLLGAGRVHQVDAAQVPPLETVQSDLVNPQLKRGDLLLMKGFTWHFADSNRPPSSGRSGLYMKFRAASSPPATGPLLFATEVAESLTHKQVMPYHREDGTQRIDQGTLVLEDAETHRVWAVGGGGGWQLPRWDIEPTAAMCSTTTAAWDSSNIIGELQAFALRDFSVQLPWMSWITDWKTASASAASVPPGGGENEEEEEHLCRVYGHLLSKSEAMPVGGDGRGRFIEPEALAAEEERHWYSHFSMLKRNFAVL